MRCTKAAKHRGARLPRFGADNLARVEPERARAKRLQRCGLAVKDWLDIDHGAPSIASIPSTRMNCPPSTPRTCCGEDLPDWAGRENGSPILRESSSPRGYTL